MSHDVVTSAHMNMNTVRLQVKDTCRPLSSRAGYTIAMANCRTLCRSGVKLIRQRAISYGYARVQLSASRSEVI